LYTVLGSKVFIGNIITSLLFATLAYNIASIVGLFYVGRIILHDKIINYYIPLYNFLSNSIDIGVQTFGFINSLNFIKGTRVEGTIV
jgi:hypothetical protein